MIGGIVLCGGQSRRMGRSKAWLPFGPEFLLQRVVRLLGRSMGPIIVVAASGQELPELPESVTIVRDPIPDRGPLSGLVTGLRALPDAVDLAYVSATDAPFLLDEWVEHLIQRLGDADLAVAEVEGRLHPLAAVYRRRTSLAAAEGLVAEGRSRLVDLVERLRTVRLVASDLVAVDPALESLRNLNTIDEYHRALRDAGLEPAK